jgi:hypothetical protein
MDDKAEIKWNKWQLFTIFGLAAALGITLYFLVSNSKAPTDQFNSTVTYLDMGTGSKGVYLAVWEDLRDGNSDIVGAIIDPQSKVVSSNFPITAGNGRQQVPSVAANTNDKEFLVVWQDERNSIGSTWDLYGQRVKQDGTLIGGNFRITNKSYDSCIAAISYNSKNNEYMIVWSDLLKTWVSCRIYGKVISHDGKTIGKTFQVAGSPQSSEIHKNPSIAYNSKQNRFMVVWEKWGSYYPYKYFSISGQCFDAAGNKIGYGTDVSPAPPAGTGSYHKWEPRIAYSATNDVYLAVWTEYQSTSSYCQFIMGARIDSNGLKILPEFNIADVPGFDEYQPSVSSSQLGFLVTFTDTRKKSTQGSNIYAQGVGFDGKLQGANFPVCDKQYDQYNSSIAYATKDNTYLVVWSDKRNMNTSGTDIYGQHLSYKGALLQTLSNENFAVSVPKITGQLKP